MKRLLTTRNAEKMAQLYAYLQHHGVPVTVAEQGQNLELWLTMSSYHAHAKALIQAYQENPELALQQLAAEQPEELPHPPSFIQQLRAQAGWFTRAYAAVVVLIFVGMHTSFIEQILSALLFNPYDYERLPWSEPWRFVTPAMLHFSILHILFNVFWWWYLGGRFERYYGTKWLILAFFICAIASDRKSVV